MTDGLVISNAALVTFEASPSPPAVQPNKAGNAPYSIAEAESINRMLKTVREQGEEVAVAGKRAEEASRVEASSTDWSKPPIDKKKGRKPRFKDDTRKKPSLPVGEIWEDDGTVGFSTVEGDNIITKTVAEWREVDPAMADIIEAAYDNAKGVYYLPGRPDTDTDDRTLIADIVRVLDQSVDLPPRIGMVTGEVSPYRTVLAAHITVSGLGDMVPVRTGILLVAETKTGKTRCVIVISLSSYHGFAIGSPTEAVVMRALGTYQVSLSIDETKDADSEVLPLILSMFKLSFDGRNIARCDMNDQRRIISYPCKGFVTLSMKNLDKVPEDVVNRGIVVHLGHKTRDIDPNEPEDGPVFKNLRTRVTALRLRIMAGKVDLDAALKRAGELAGMPYVFNCKAYVLESRDFSKAKVLLTPVVLMGEDPQQVKDVIEVILRAKIEGDKTQCQTFAAKCWFALYDEIATLWTKGGTLAFNENGVPVKPPGYKDFIITTKNLADSVRATLKNEGEIRDDKDLPGRRVTETLESLLFTFRSGHARAYYLVTDDPSFEQGWKNCMQKYGPPPDYEQGPSNVAFYQ